MKNKKDMSEFLQGKRDTSEFILEASNKILNEINENSELVDNLITKIKKKIDEIKYPESEINALKQSISDDMDLSSIDIMQDISSHMSEVRDKAEIEKRIQKMESHNEEKTNLLNEFVGYLDSAKFNMFGLTREKIEFIDHVINQIANPSMSDNIKITSNMPTRISDFVVQNSNPLTTELLKNGFTISTTTDFSKNGNMIYPSTFNKNGVQVTVDSSKDTYILKAKTIDGEHIIKAEKGEINTKTLAALVNSYAEHLGKTPIEDSERIRLIHSKFTEACVKTGFDHESKKAPDWLFKEQEHGR